MSTETQPIADVKPAITEADVVAFLANQIRNLSEATGEVYCQFEVIAHSYDAKSSAPARITWKAYTPTGAFTEGRDAASAIAANAAKAHPAARAKTAREQAAKLLAEATQLEMAGKEAA